MGERAPEVAFNCRTVARLRNIHSVYETHRKDPQGIEVSNEGTNSKSKNISNLVHNIQAEK